MSKHEQTIGQKVDNVANETKKITNGIEKWWNTSSVESRITTIVGGLFVLIALWELKYIIWQLGLLVIGILGITGMFDSFVKEVVEFVQEQYKKVSEKKEKDHTPDHKNEQAETSEEA